MADKVIVGCKLPHGVVLPALKQMPEEFTPPTLNGAYTHPSFDERVGSLQSIAFGKTEVDADYWAAFAEQYKDWPPLKKGLIFAAQKAADVKATAKDAEAIPTGLAGADPDAKGSGVQKADIK